MAYINGLGKRARLFSNALGIKLMFASLRGLTGPELDEPVKTAVHRHRFIAFLHTSVHLVPTLVALTEVCLNWHGTYLGANVTGLSYLQFAAKAHELTMLASISAIIFSYIRHELSIGQGLPFGALLSGFRFTQISYLWSMEFWGAIFSNLPIRRKLAMFIIITLGASLAAIAGPSSAILLIPRLDYWPAGSTHVWINATSDELWPKNLTGSTVPRHCSVVSNSSNGCPSSEWQSIGTYLSLANDIIPPRYLGPYTISPFSVQLTGQSSLRQLIIQHYKNQNNALGYDHEAAQATTQQAVVADTLTTISALWIVGLQRTKSSFNDQRDAAQTIASGYYQPYTVVSCGFDVIEGDSDTRPLAFPVPPGSSVEMLSKVNVTKSILEMPAIEYSGLTRSQILETHGSPDSYRLRWVELPRDLFNGTTIGAVAIPPSKNSTREILVCNLSAGWGSSLLNMSSTPSMSKTDLVSSKVQATASDSSKDYMKRLVDSIMTFDLPRFPEQLIHVDKSWAQYLNPIDPSSNKTVFDALMGAKMIHKEDSVSARIILAGLLANGLSRLSHASQLQGTLRTVHDPLNNFSIPDGPYWFGGKGDMFSVDTSQNPSAASWVKLRVDSTVEGYAYDARGVAPKLAIATLLCYCTLAILHMTYSTISGITFTSWASIAEIVALAMNSAPTDRLQNTCAGISQSHIFKLPVRILARRNSVASDDDDGNKHLELVFGHYGDVKSGDCDVKENQTYGTKSNEKRQP